MPVQPSNRNKRWALGLLIVAGLLVLFFGLRYLLRDQVTVRSAKVEFQPLISTLNTNGKVEPVDNYEAHAAAPGVVEKVYVDEGDKVSAGKLLLTLSAEDARARLAEAYAKLMSAQAALTAVKTGGTQEEQLSLSSQISTAQLQRDQAERDLAAVRQLQQKGAASSAEVESAEERFQTAQAQLQSLQKRRTGRYNAEETTRAEAAVADSRAAYAAAQDNLNSVELRAPFAGTVYSIPVSASDFVPAGEDLFDIADLNHIRVRAYFDEPEIGQLAVGQPVKIVWEAKPGSAWHGHIVATPTTIVPYGTRNVGEALISVDDPDGQLLPNINVTITVTTLSKPNVLSIPREALHTDGTQDFVYVIDGGKLRRTYIKVGALNLIRVEVLGGLMQGQTVALNIVGTAQLSNGLHVDNVE